MTVHAIRAQFRSPARASGLVLGFCALTLLLLSSFALAQPGLAPGEHCDPGAGLSFAAFAMDEDRHDGGALHAHGPACLLHGGCHAALPTAGASAGPHAAGRRWPAMPPVDLDGRAARPETPPPIAG